MFRHGVTVPTNKLFIIFMFFLVCLRTLGTFVKLNSQLKKTKNIFHFSPPFLQISHNEVMWYKLYDYKAI